MGIEGQVGAVGGEVLERKPDFLPAWSRRKAHAVGLPRARQVRGPEVQAIVLAIAPDVEGDAGEAGCIEGRAAGRQVEGDLQ